MEIVPAIDLLDGKVVRLYQGDYAQKEVFGDDPVVFAKSFEKAGAKYLHLVDLNGAKEGAPQNFAVIEKLAAATSLAIELGGGIRTEETVKQCFAAGISKVILGTAALRDPTFASGMIAQYGDAVAVGVDARDGMVAVDGWLETSQVDSIAFCRRMQEVGAKNIIYTDISRDGAGRGTNLAVYRQLRAALRLHITASGGVSSLGDIQQLHDMGIDAAILGKALYTGAIDLKEAVDTARNVGGKA